jgi:hypothetical protein
MEPFERDIIILRTKLFPNYAARERRAEMVVTVMEFEDDQSVMMAARLPNYRRGGGDLCQLNDVLIESGFCALDLFAFPACSFRNSYFVARPFSF